MASNRDFYQPTLIALEVIDEINNDLDSDEEDLYEGNESYDDEEGGDIFTNLMRAAIDQSLDLDLESRSRSSFRAFVFPQRFER